MAGALFFVVGPSGIGKDTLLKGAKERLSGRSDFIFARRVITRPEGLGDEGHQAATTEEFARMRANGAFLIDWNAHGLSYGVPIEVDDELKAGKNVVVNGSRAAVTALVARVRNVIVVEITASPDVIKRRLAVRGRETAEQIEARVRRETPPFPKDATVVTISNDRDVESGVSELVSVFCAYARDVGRRLVRSLDGLLRAKAEGATLSEDQYRSALGAIVRGECAHSEVEPFLIAASKSLSLDEVAAIAKVRSEFGERITWPDAIVVDKHSLGGVPGGRITLIVVPIVAAHGLAMPKASSRAITSAAGTADAMETVARVDLSAGEVMEAVAAARGCIVWNGRLNHSALDDVMNAITRPLGLDSARWSVASILSKKLSAGITNLIVDLPYGPFTKLKTEREAKELAELFTTVGAGLGLSVHAEISAGREPIGRGVGPALEVRDVLQVLDNRPTAPVDLKSKALSFAAKILSWAPDIRSEAAAYQRASDLLASGAARAAFERIVDAQGRRTPPAQPGRLAAVVRSARSGIVVQINGWTTAGVARAAGAPRNPGSGIDLRAKKGDEVRAGDALYEIRSDREDELAAAVGIAASDSGFVVQ